MTKAVFVFFIATVGIVMGLFGQRNQNKQYLRWYSEAGKLYNLENPTEQTDNKALQLFLQSAEAAFQEGDNYKLVTDCYIKAGNIHQTYQRYTLSNELYHRAIFFYDRHLKNGTVAYEAYLYLGSSFYFSNIIDSAQHYFERASVIAVNNTGQPLPEQERLYNSLGAIYFESANYQQAKNYFERALLATKSDASDYEETFVSVKSNIANCLLHLKQYDSALSIYKKLLSYHTHQDIILQNTAHTYFQLGMYDTALSLYKKLPVKPGLNRIKALNDIGRIYLNRGEWLQAEAVFDSAIHLNKNISQSIKNKEEALAYLYRSQLAEKQGLLDEAVTWCNEALQEIHLSFKWKKAEDIPDDISKTVSPGVLFDVLQTKASLLFKKYKATGKLPFLTASLLAYRKTILTAKFIKKSFDNDEALIFFTRNYKPIYTEALQAAYEAVSHSKHYIDDYLFIVENYKGRVLYHNLQNIQLKTNADIPDSVKQKEKEIKQQLAFYRSRISDNTQEKDVARLQNRLVELQVSLSRLQKEYEQDEAYNLYKYQTEEDESTLSFIQSAIDHETALVNYFVDDSVIYALAIEKKHFELARIPVDSVFKRSFKTYLGEVYEQTEGKRYEGFGASSHLYNSLVKPIERIAGKKSRWIIIPNDFLYYLPFEGLVKDPGSRRYVLLDKKVSYHYSFALLLKENTHHYSGNNNQSPLGFAPYSAGDEKITGSGLQVLPYSEQEVNALGKHTYLAEAATKNQFVAKASNYSLIHLATHGSLGEDSASNWIQFYPSDSSLINNKLFVHEIYNLDLHQAELVILSACETGSGVTISGEGLLSLSRAFMYAGSDGIISTLWKTEDRVTAYLMQRLHDYLNQNHSPEKALQLAKTDFLNSREFGSQYKTPNYWSNFIYVGKVKSQEHKTSNYWWALAILAISFGVAFYWKRNSGKNAGI